MTGDILTVFPVTNVSRSHGKRGDNLTRNCSVTASVLPHVGAEDIARKMGAVVASS
eukprot:CAMPEP_0171311088 /NCGR_PEP_ID=MMETSP0816-20121228/21321_1 /TAXON_ID=420281 /ORGANISM="Proboscia inermis, Strain CCAP1064/1" /LENGTH=55 /DNA_ID=CAMNT_0011795631 /DNA_START=34 /DNA_END=198 /DNA_ORIENTATION=+